jgi:hypothetical protein
MTIHKAGGAIEALTGKLYCCFTAALLLLYCCFTAALAAPSKPSQASY